jgi:nucleoid-associated protein YgaU
MPEKDPNKPDFSDVVGGSSSTAPSSKGRPAGAAEPSSKGRPAGAAAGGTGTQADGFKDVVGGSSSTAASTKGGEARTYIVQSGDSLSKIAKRFYGNANEWRRIFEANKDRISNPDMIQPGWALKIPE